MGIRSPRKTRRLITSAVAFVSLGALAVGAAVLTTDTLSSSDAEVELASTATCYDMVSIAIGGRGDTPSNSATKFLTTPDGTALPAALAGDFESDWIDQMVGAPNDAVKQGSYAAVYIDYPANLATYETAVDTGVQNAQTVMKAIVASCPKTRFAIVGYSEGADVTRRTAMEIGNQVADDNGKYGIVDPSQVVGVVILADAGREDGDNPFPGSKTGTNPDNFDTKYQNNASGPAGAGALPGTAGSFGALDGKVASFCSQKDLTCAMPQNTSLLHLAANVGRQLDVDAIQRDNTVTPATGADMAMVIGRIAGLAFMDIASQDNWLAGDETFLEVLIKVSEPGYTPADPTTKVSAKTDTEEGTDPTEEPLPADKAVNLAYLPSKIVKEIVGLIGSNTDTVPVLMNDPYGQTLGPGSGAHFDYWRDADASNGRPLTSAQYAAAWLTQLAKDAEAGKPIKSAEVQQKALLVAQSATPAPTTTSAAPVASGASAQPAAPAAPAAPLAAVPAVPAEVAPAAPVEGSPAPGVPVESAPAVVTETPAAPSTTEAPVTTSVAPTTTATPTP